mmetsp:Transcript_34286/g.70741  ORF Transcript_34286/g.70741 Transcript_34286/m.70741 type:complete len:143 (+) Transcript_34286:436-864(+)
MKEAGNSVGIDFTGKCDRAPNTILAHCLMLHALKTKGAVLQNELQEVIFRSYFTDGVYPDVENLTAMGAEVGLDKGEVKAMLESGQYEKQVLREASEYSNGGVNGVPFFIINGHPAFSGAQDPRTFLKAFEKLAAEPAQKET